MHLSYKCWGVISDQFVRMMLAAELAPMVTAGRIQCFGVLNPEGGSQRKTTENSRISIIPIQKLGIETPAMETTRQMLSIREYCRVAETMPAVTPTITAITMLSPASLTVVGKR